MTHSTIESTEFTLDSFPPLPTTVAKVIEVTNNPDSSANDLVRAIVSDQSMCTAILKIANSTLFGSPQKVGSLERAIMVLGFNEVQSIILSKAVVSSFNELFQEHKSAVNSFWDHSFTSGLAAKTIAEHLNLPAGQFFIGGLLHDIGKLAMFLSFPTEYSPAEWMSDFSSEQHLNAEKQTFPLSHDVIGSRILKKWQFPEDILFALEYHHNSAKAPDFTVYASVVQLSDILSHLCCNPDRMAGQDLIPAINSHLPEIETHWRSLGLPWEVVVLETWFAWLKIERENGSSIITILSS